jgi:hypothetical protein
MSCSTLSTQVWPWMLTVSAEIKAVQHRALLRTHLQFEVVAAAGGGEASRQQALWPMTSSSPKPVAAAKASLMSRVRPVSAWPMKVGTGARRKDLAKRRAPRHWPG